MALKKFTINKTPAPNAVSAIRSPSGLGYGQNDGASNPSSVAPGKRVISPLGANLESSVDDDGVLAHVITNGAKLPNAGGVGSQTRVVDDTPFPPAHGMRSQTVDSKAFLGPVKRK